MSLCGFGPFCLNSPCRELVTAGLDLPFPSLSCPDTQILGRRHWDLTLLCVILTSTHSLGRLYGHGPSFTLSSGSRTIGKPDLSQSQVVRTKDSVRGCCSPAIGC